MLETNGSNNKAYDKADSGPDIEMDLEHKSCVGNKDESSSDQNEIPKGIAYTKDF